MQDPDLTQDTIRSSTKDLVDTYVVPNYSRYPYCFKEGKGVQIWDDQGRAYLDFGGGIAVSSLGHSHPAITSAIHAQVESLVHCSNLYYIREQGLLAQNLVEQVVQAPGKVFFCNSGAEANEALFKLARLFGTRVPHAGGSNRFEIITFEGSFHGRTLAGISATGQAKVKEGFAPLMPGFVTVHFNNLEAVRSAITKQTAAILLEPIQGEGGIHAADPEFLRGVAQLCREHHLLLMFDEVQCGLGRTGDTCGYKSIIDDPEVQPDAIAWAKGLGGGIPIGAIWVRQRALSEDQPDKALCNLFGPGTHGSTFGGQPLACAASLAVMEEIQRYKLWENSAKVGQYIRDSILSWNHPLISQMRGLGLMIGIALKESAFENGVAGYSESGSTAAAFLVGHLMRQGLITIPAGKDVIRLLPPLNLAQSEATEALSIIKDTLDLLANQKVVS